MQRSNLRVEHNPSVTLNVVNDDLIDGRSVQPQQLGPLGVYLQQSSSSLKSRLLIFECFSVFAIDDLATWGDLDMLASQDGVVEAFEAVEFDLLDLTHFQDTLNRDISDRTLHHLVSGLASDAKLVTNLLERVAHRPHVSGTLVSGNCFWGAEEVTSPIMYECQDASPSKSVGYRRSARCSAMNSARTVPSSFM